MGVETDVHYWGKVEGKLQYVTPTLGLHVRLKHVFNMADAMVG